MCWQMLTQFDSRNKDPIDVVIGFDLGTSCTKVVLQSPYFGGSPAYLVPFGEYSHPASPYLLPTNVSVKPNGVFDLDNGGAELVCREIKLKLLNGDPGQTFKNSMGSKQLSIGSFEFAVAYMALVLRLARQWFIENKKDLFGGYRVRWHLNVGIPSAGYDDDEKRALFADVARKAWVASTIEAGISIDAAMTIARSKTEPDALFDIHPDDINVIPEVAAEVVGYAKSHFRNSGLHVLIDIGASTLDVAGFNLQDKEGEDRYNILSTKLEWLGAYVCHIARVNAVREFLWASLDHVAGGYDLIEALPASLQDYRDELHRLEFSDERKINKGFYEQCKRTISSVLVSLKRDRDPLADEWSAGLPVFVCGGGSSLEIYRTVLKDLDGFWKTSMNTKGFRIQNLPTPENLEADGVQEEEYHRFAVAYGLSYPEHDIGEIVPPTAIPDMERKPRSSKYDGCEYIGKEMM